MFFERLFGNFRNLYNSTTDNKNVRELQLYYRKLLSNSQKHSLYMKNVGVGIMRQCRAWKMAKRNWLHLHTLYMQIMQARLSTYMQQDLCYWYMYSKKVSLTDFFQKDSFISLSCAYISFVTCKLYMYIFSGHLISTVFNTFTVY